VGGIEVGHSQMSDESFLSQCLEMKQRVEIPRVVIAPPVEWNIMFHYIFRETLFRVFRENTTGSHFTVNDMV
jgi:hypothetical protein